MLLASAVGSGLLLVCLGVADSLPLAIAAAAFSGPAQAIFMAASYSAIQTMTLSSFRGRASVSTMLNAGSMGGLGLGWGAGLADERIANARPLLPMSVHADDRGTCCPGDG